MLRGSLAPCEQQVIAAIPECPCGSNSAALKPASRHAIAKWVLFLPSERCTRSVVRGKCMNRRLFALALGSALAGVIASNPARAQSSERAVDANRVFAHLLDYYSIPAGERT